MPLAINWKAPYIKLALVAVIFTGLLLLSQGSSQAHATENPSQGENLRSITKPTKGVIKRTKASIPNERVILAATSCVAAPSGLVSWWDADTVSGSTAFDIGDGNGDQQYIALIAMDITGADPQTVAFGYQWSKWETREISSVLYGGKGLTPVGVEGRFCRDQEIRRGDIQGGGWRRNSYLLPQ